MVLSSSRALLDGSKSSLIYEFSMPDLPTRLARKHVNDWKLYGEIGADLHLYVAAAIREALQETRKCVRDCQHQLHGCDRCWNL